MELAVVYVGFVVLALAMAWAQRRSPSSAAVSLHPRTRHADWSWWLFSPLVTGVLTRIATFAALDAFSRLAATDRTSLLTRARDVSPVDAMPFTLEVLVMLVVADVVGTLSHRLRHTRLLWPFHAIHHSPRELDFLAAARMHPVDDVIDNTIVGVAVLLCGFSPDAFRFLGPALILHTMLLHANVTWTFGPLHHVLASPAFHRLHHARSADGVACNFAGLFPFIDVAMGTFRRAHREETALYGIEPDVPRSLWGQLLHPFR